MPCSRNRISPTVSDPLPPMTINPSMPKSASVALTRSTPPAVSRGLPRFVPRTVPPLGKVPLMVSTVSGRVRRSISPSHASTNPMISSPNTRSPLRTMARITAFKPGQSPPPVRTPMRTFRMICPSADRTNAWHGIAVVRFPGSASFASGSSTSPSWSQLSSLPFNPRAGLVRSPVFSSVDRHTSRLEPCSPSLGIAVIASAEQHRSPDPKRHRRSLDLHQQNEPVAAHHADAEGAPERRRGLLFRHGIF